MSPEKRKQDLVQLREVLDEIKQMSEQSSDGKWLERLTADCAPLIPEWDVHRAWIWDEWPEKPHRDIGIDVVAETRDGALVAIQCKSRQLDERGHGHPIPKSDIDSFLSAASGPDAPWEQRWLVVNAGAVHANPNAEPVMNQHGVRLVNLANDISRYLESIGGAEDEDSDGVMTRDAMQKECVATAVDRLKAQVASGAGQSRGRIILPCGTGKSRIALRIVEALSEPGDVAAVLCPSIALVSQLRAEFLTHTHKSLAALAVCSDSTVTKVTENTTLADDPTADLSHMNAREIKGIVTTDANKISEWMKNVPEDHVGVVFGTYQSSRNIGEALRESGTTLSVMVADEAHRTAGLRRAKGDDKPLRDFAICHHGQQFPATHRVYMTATPKVFKTTKEKRNDNKLTASAWIARSMDDEQIFGPELYRRSYRDAVENGWLSDYRIIAVGVNDEDAYNTANQLAEQAKGKLSTSQFLRGLALALVMAGYTRKDGGEPVRSSINFMNTIAKSDEMTKKLQSDTVKRWVSEHLAKEKLTAGDYRLEHLDATDSIDKRNHAKTTLAEATVQCPRGILNVGIFGEGVDAPSLSAVGFLEPRKSPVEVIQAVGRVMRRHKNKALGYIVCPILIPRDVDAEKWLSTSHPDDGWQALGQILRALRAHDGRIEDRLSELMECYLPPTPESDVATVVAIGHENGRTAYHGHIGKPGTAERAAEKVLKGEVKPTDVFVPFAGVMTKVATPKGVDDRKPGTERDPGNQPKAEQSPHPQLEANRIVVGKAITGGGIDMREDGVRRDKHKPDGTPGPVNPDKTKKHAKDMLNEKAGYKIKRRKRQTSEERKDVREQGILSLIQHTKADDMGLYLNILERSGLCSNKPQRSVNMLEDAIDEAVRALKSDELDRVLDAKYAPQGGKSGKSSADGCTVAALLLMNAAMLHQRIACGGWLYGVGGLDRIKNAPDAEDIAHREWNRITRHDFLPVVEPAIEVIEVIRDTGRLSGLNQAIRHIAAEGERLAEDYANMGTDYAGELFNKVMGNQASDGAYFTRPQAAALLARLALDATAPEANWTHRDTWESHKVVDLACGSGTLLAASLTEMKRRAEGRGASRSDLTALQKHAVENTLVGMDINPVSLQLAAAQLTAGNDDVAYRNMRLYRMPYGPTESSPPPAGSLELLAQSRVVAQRNALELEDRETKAEQLQMRDDPTLEDAVEAAMGARIVIMNPPFTNRTKMGEKFPDEVQNALRQRVDALESGLIRNDPELEGVASKTAIAPLFEMLADRVADTANGVVAMVWPTIVCSGPSNEQIRRVLAKRFHIHTLLTCHCPGNVNLSQNTAINESLIVMRRHGEGETPPTRIVALDRFPDDDAAVRELYEALDGIEAGSLPDGWGEVSRWPAKGTEAGDWTAGVFRAPALAEAAFEIAHSSTLIPMEAQGMVPSAVLDGGAQMAQYKRGVKPDVPGAFAVLASKSADVQRKIRGTPDEYWAPRREVRREQWVDLPDADDSLHPDTARVMRHAAHLLVTAGQDTGTGRLTSVVRDEPSLGLGWLPVPGIMLEQARAASVFLNSTAGRLQLMRNPGMKLAFPKYRPAGLKTIRLPDLSDKDTVERLARCWETTADMEVPQYREGECEVRRIWDDAVSDTLGWDKEWLTELRQWLHREPHVRGLGYNQFG